MNRLAHKTGLAALAAALLTTACTSIQPVTFERLAAADVSFPETVRRIAVVNNVPVIEPESQAGVLTPWMEADGPTATEALAEEIASTRYFESVVIADSALNTRGATGLDETLLTHEQITRCTADLDADLLVSLDRVILQVRPTYIYDDGVPFPVEGVEAVITPVVRVYLPERDAPLFTIAPSDSIHWLASPQLTDSLVRHEAADYAGGIPLRHLLPHWQEISRYYYDGGNVDMRDAAVNVREQQWAEAAALWRRVYDTKRGRVHRLAAYNLALYYEMQDEASRALKYIDEVVAATKPGSEERLQAEAYKEQLTHRAKEIGKLGAQMQRFDEKNTNNFE
jgi:hypothetical protein